MSGPNVPRSRSVYAIPPIREHTGYASSGRIRTSSVRRVPRNSFLKKPLRFGSTTKSGAFQIRENLTSPLPSACYRISRHFERWTAASSWFFVSVQNNSKSDAEFLRDPCIANPAGRSARVYDPLRSFRMGTAVRTLVKRGDSAPARDTGTRRYLRLP